MECKTCGSFPVGSGCYRICPNSDHYYSPEREREDDLNYTRADYEYDRWADMREDAMREAQAEAAYWEESDEERAYWAWVESEGAILTVG